MSKLKKVVATLMATAAIASMSVTAFAVDYDSPDFNFNLGKYGTTYSAAVYKQDDLSYAKANCREGNIDSTAYIWLSVYSDYTGKRISNEVKATSLYNYQLDYYSGEYWNGRKCKLCGKTDAYGAYVKGNWDP